MSHVNVKQLFSPFISFNLHSSMTSKAVWIFERSLRIHGSYYALFWTYLSCTHRTHYIFWLKIKETSQSRSKKSVSACQIFYFCHCCCMVQPIDQIRKKRSVHLLVPLQRFTQRDETRLMKIATLQLEDCKVSYLDSQWFMANSRTLSI